LCIKSCHRSAKYRVVDAPEEDIRGFVGPDGIFAQAVSSYADGIGKKQVRFVHIRNNPKADLFGLFVARKQKEQGSKGHNEP
jgi:hypothetical protein